MHCQVCGQEAETGWHTVVQCTKARALCQELRQFWVLPDENQLKHSGPDWLLLLFDFLDDRTRARTLLLFWCAWRPRNDAVHAQGKANVKGSTMFLISYAESLDMASSSATALENVKGKEPVHGQDLLDKEAKAADQRKRKNRSLWQRPDQGWVKINTNGGFCPQTQTTSTGVVARDREGNIILTDWRSLSHCDSLEEAEAKACLDRVRLVVEWVCQPVQVEADCLSLVKAIKGEGGDRASWGGIISEIIGTSNLLPACKFNHVGREANEVTHRLARRGLQMKEWVVMRFDMPNDENRSDSRNS
jgi:hypothetical protein